MKTPLGRFAAALLLFSSLAVDWASIISGTPSVRAEQPARHVLGPSIVLPAEGASLDDRLAVEVPEPVADALAIPEQPNDLRVAEYVDDADLPQVAMPTVPADSPFTTTVTQDRQPRRLEATDVLDRYGFTAVVDMLTVTFLSAFFAAMSYIAIRRLVNTTFGSDKDYRLLFEEEYAKTMTMLSQRQEYEQIVGSRQHLRDSLSQTFDSLLQDTVCSTCNNRDIRTCKLKLAACRFQNTHLSSRN